MRWVACKDGLPEPYTEVLVWVDGHRGSLWRNTHALVAYMDTGGNWWEERHKSDEPLVGVYLWAEIAIPESDVRPVLPKKSSTCAVCGDTRELQDSQAWDCGQPNSECPYCPHKVDEYRKEVSALRELLAEKTAGVRALTLALSQRDEEVAALQERVREAHAMLRPDTFWRGGDIYKPVIRLPELERWETTPEVQRELGCREEQPNRNFRWFRGEVDRDLVRRMNEAAALEEER